MWVDFCKAGAAAAQAARSSGAVKVPPKMTRQVERLSLQTRVEKEEEEGVGHASAGADADANRNSNRQQKAVETGEVTVTVQSDGIQALEVAHVHDEVQEPCRLLCVLYAPFF
jgi:hypothetical protein